MIVDPGLITICGGFAFGAKSQNGEACNIIIEISFFFRVACNKGFLMPFEHLDNKRLCIVHLTLINKACCKYILSVIKVKLFGQYHNTLLKQTFGIF